MSTAQVKCFACFKPVKPEMMCLKSSDFGNAYHLRKCARVSKTPHKKISSTEIMSWQCMTCKKGAPSNTKDSQLSGKCDSDLKKLGVNEIPLSVLRSIFCIRNILAKQTKVHDDILKKMNSQRKIVDEVENVLEIVSAKYAESLTQAPTQSKTSGVLEKKN